MFSKSYKLKSTNTLKNTEKKHLAQRILDSFSTATEEKVKELVSVKSNSSYLKLILHSGETVAVYAVEGVPIMIEIGNTLVPTVCALWKVPDLIPTLTIHAPVLSKVLGGAPLYLPGIVLPSGGVGFPMFARGAPLAACTSNNAAAAVIGRATLSSGDMLLRPGGVALDTIQVIGDLLCKDPKFSKIERPKLGAPFSYQHVSTASITADIGQLNIKPSFKEEWPSLGKPEPRPAPALNEPKIITEVPQDSAQIHTDNIDHVNEMQLDDSIKDDSQMEEDCVPSDMDGLLQWCLFSFLKTEGKRIELPLKTNLLYKNHLMPLCPPDRSLDVKKSSYKKMGKFLEAMQKEALLEVHELEKGVDAITAINLMHPLVRAHRPLAASRAPPSDPTGGEYSPPHVAEMYCVTANIAQLFTPIKKGTPLTPTEIRTTLTEYVRGRNLNSTTNKGCVTLDRLLANITGQSEHEPMKWDELMSSVQNKMTACTQMLFADGSVTLTKTKLEPIKMQVANRSGNKKVTLVSNLESFGFSLQELSRVCQHGVAASCGVTRTPGAKCDQLMLQGDQTHFVAKLLIEKYGLPKKYVEGADKALKKKK